VRYAAATVPYYQDLFRKLGIDPGAVRTADDLTRLPLVDKATVRADPTRFVSTSRAGSRSVAFVTSGTTGEPVEVRHDHGSLLKNIAYGERERAVVQEVCGPHFRELHVNYDRATVRKVWAFYRERTLIPAPTGRRVLDVSMPIPELLAAMNELRPDVIIGFGSFLETLFRIIAAGGHPIHRPRMLLHVADGMTPEGRRMIEGEFGIPVFSRYNAMESFKIGFQCRAGPGFHLHADLCHVRVVDAEGRDVEAGVPGEIVISNLVNRGTVLLNYRLGDRGTLAREPCSCGRTFPLLAALEGRSEDVVELADGRLVHPRSIWSVLLPRRGILRYQLVQRAPARFQLRLATADQATFERLRPEIERDLAELLADSEIEIVRVRDLGLGEPGKFRPVRALSRDLAPQDPS
jgi:phenylacetate-CoA ligase